MIARQYLIQNLPPTYSLKLILSILLIFLLTGCGENLVKPSSETQLLWESHQQRLQTLNKWQLNGRVAVYNDHENWLIKVRWDQNLDKYQLHFYTPSGQGVAKLVGMSQQVEMFTAENQHYVAQHPDALVAQTFNINLPVTGLRFWIRGMPTPDVPIDNYYLNKQGYLTQLEQDGWKINFQTYAKSSNWFLPKKLLLTNSQYKVKIIVLNWHIS